MQCKEHDNWYSGRCCHSFPLGHHTHTVFSRFLLPRRQAPVRVNPTSETNLSTSRNLSKSTCPSATSSYIGVFFNLFSLLFSATLFLLQLFYLHSTVDVVQSHTHTNILICFYPGVSFTLSHKTNVSDNKKKVTR